MRRDGRYIPSVPESRQLQAAELRATGAEVVFDHPVCEELVTKGYLQAALKSGARAGDRDGTIYELTPEGRELHAGRTD